ncbi:serine acetyltransferase [Rhodococcus hoagii]|nr:serine acetyltransferase [Prescottella equi]
MITSKSGFREYTQRDAQALGISPSLRRHFLRALGLKYEIWDFQRQLRTTEYLVNTNRFWARRILAKVRLRRKAMKLGFSIPINVFGPGLSIAHRGDIVVNGAARIGADCRIHVGVNIGTAAGSKDAAPTIGDSCYIGPGAKIFGPISIGDGVAIGANSVVNKDFPDGFCSLGGVPARRISDKDSISLLIAEPGGPRSD